MVGAVSPHQWLIAFIAACALHVMAGGLIWIAQNAPRAPEHSPRGVMVSLDSLMVGDQAQLNTTPETVIPVRASSATPTPASTPALPTAVTPAPAAVVPAAPSLATPEPIEPSQPTAVGATPKTGGVDIPVADAVTIQAADTLQALEQTTTIQATPPSASTSSRLGSGANGVSKDPTMTYIARIRMWLGTHKYYPQAARTSGAQGIVRLYLIVDRKGNVLNVAVAESSGSSILDQAAMDMVKRSEPLPAMTKNMLRTRLEIILPVQFTLGNVPNTDATPTTQPVPPGDYANDRTD